MSKLYEIPKGSKIQLELTDGKWKKQEICTFHHLDGAYSLIETPQGDYVHLSASAELVNKGKFYVLA